MDVQFDCREEGIEDLAMEEDSAEVEFVLRTTAKQAKIQRTRSAGTGGIFFQPSASFLFMPAV